jgi:hypothetical protein
MRRGLLILSIGFVLFFMVSATQVRADGVDTFTFTEFNFAGTTENLVATWNLPASPTGITNFAIGGGFETPNPVDVTATFMGTTFTSPDTFVFLNSAVGGGFLDLFGIFFATPGSDQFYSGLENAPTFMPGTYFGFDSGFGGEATLSIAAPSIATPEPSALLLLASGLVAFMLCVTLKKQIL